MLTAFGRHTARRWQAGAGEGERKVTVHYSRDLDAQSWQQRYDAGEVPDRWPYGLHHLSEGANGVQVSPASARNSLAIRGVRKLAGGYDWHRMTSPGDTAVCWDERAGVPVALSGVPTLTGVIWLTERSTRHWTDRWARRALGRSTVFVLSPLQLPELRDHWGVSADRSHFLPFGVDKDFWRPAQGAMDGVLVVGNDRDRDHDTAIQAATGTGHRLTVVTKQQVPAPRVSYLSHPELVQSYADHAVVVVATRPNLHASGVTVVLEAMACARPVIATRGGGLESYITPDTGVLVPAGDSQALGRELQGLLNDPDRAGALGRGGRVAVEKQYNTSAMAARLRELVRTLGT